MKTQISFVALAWVVVGFGWPFWLAILGAAAGIYLWTAVYTIIRNSRKP